MKQWDRQKILKLSTNISSYEDIINTAKKINDIRLRALYIFQYLTAGRISEITKNKIKVEVEGKKRKVTIEQGVKKKDIKFINVNGRDIMLIKIPNRKNKKRLFKEIPIPIEKEKELIDLLNQYLQIIQDEEYIFPFTKRWAQHLLSKELNINSHWIRHIRATHLVINHDFNEQLLIMFMGWTDSRPAKNYMELRWKDILQKY